MHTALPSGVGDFVSEAHEASTGGVEHQAGAVSDVFELQQSALPVTLELYSVYSVG